MARIKTYKVDVNITDNDIVIGSDFDDRLISKNYTMSGIRQYVVSGLPPTGGLLKVSEVSKTNPIHTTPEEVMNNINPSFDVLEYHVVIVDVDGNKYLLNKQDFKAGLLGDYITVSNDFISIIATEKLGTGTFTYRGYNPSTQKHEYIGIKSVGFDINEVSNDIEIEPKAGVNLGSGSDIYKQLNPTTKIHEFKRIKSVGNNITDSGNDISIEPKQGVSLGDGAATVYKGLNATTKLHEFFKLKSDTLQITQNEINNLVSIEIPTQGAVASLYVNSAYIPSYDEWLRKKNITTQKYKGDGTLSRPITNTIEYTSPTTFVITPDTSIQNALDLYVGTGTAGLLATDPLPQRSGEQIVIQNNLIGYNFTGNFNYKNINVKLEDGAIINHNPIGSNQYLLDMDAFADNNYFIATLFLSNNSIIYLSQNGIRNRGSNFVGSGFTNSKVVRVFGSKGSLIQINTASTNPSLYSVIESNATNATGYANDSDATFFVKDIRIQSYKQMLHKIGAAVKGSPTPNVGEGRIVDFRDVEFSYGRIGFSVLSTSKPCKISGTASVRSLSCEYYVFGNELIDSLFDLSGSSVLLMSNPLFNGRMTTLFHNTSTVDKPLIRCLNSRVLDGVFFGTITGTPNRYIFTSNLATGKWDTIYINNCFFNQGVIDYSKIDLKGSGGFDGSINIIGGSNFNLQVVINVPTSTTGLATNSLYSSAGTLKIV